MYFFLVQKRRLRMCDCPQHAGYRADECPEPNCSCFHSQEDRQPAAEQIKTAEHPEPPSSEEIAAMCEVPG